MIQGVVGNYHESTEIRYSVKVKIDLAYSRLRLHRALGRTKISRNRCTGSNVPGSNWRPAVICRQRVVISFPRSNDPNPPSRKKLQNVGEAQELERSCELLVIWIGTLIFALHQCTFQPSTRCLRQPVRSPGIQLTPEGYFVVGIR